MQKRLDKAIPEYYIISMNNNKKTLTEGTRIYYTGDMANLEGFGTITKFKADRFGGNFEITLDDGRYMLIAPHIISEVYEGHCGSRFVTLEAYNTWRKESLKKAYGEDILKIYKDFK